VIEVSLVVEGVDLSDDKVLDILSYQLADLMWERTAGRTTATLHVANNPVLSAVAAAERIRQEFPDAVVARVDREIVGVPEIADRASVSPEAVRHWVAGTRGPGGFPTPIASTGGGKKGASKLWYWRDVSEWLAETYNLHDDVDHLTDRQTAQIEERLTRPISDGARTVMVEGAAEKALRSLRVDHIHGTGSIKIKSIKVRAAGASGWVDLEG
jgi:hypothetical protein